MNCLKLSENVNFQKLDINQKTWSKAKEYIAGGNMLFSKRPDVFLPGKWPSYFTKANGCTIQALDGKKYI
jgi:glutamate-1-semialdehyde aminotransferase